jgi:hypothetical protein
MDDTAVVAALVHGDPVLLLEDEEGHTDERLAESPSYAQADESSPNDAHVKSFGLGYHNIIIWGSMFSLTTRSVYGGYILASVRTRS